MSSKSKKKVKEPIEEVTGEEVKIEKVEDEVTSTATETKEEPKVVELSPLEEKDLQIAQLKKELEAAKAFSADCKMDMLRKQADLDNYRKRLVREKENHARFANEAHQHLHFPRLRFQRQNLLKRGEVTRYDRR